MTQNTATKLYRLPNGTSVHQTNPAETDHLYRQIYVENFYFRNGILLPESPYVVDGGANIGLFSLYLLQRYPAARILAVEPAPKTFRHLQANMAAYQGVTVRNCALGGEDGQMPFMYFPNVTCASGQYDEETIRQMESTARSKLLESEKNASAFRGASGQELLEWIIGEQLKKEVITVPVLSLDTLIRDAAIAHIDLLKLDVEGCEYPVLAGIRDDHWPMIDQMVIEVHDSPVTLPRLVEILQARGFTLTCREEDAQFRKAFIWARRDA
jgi:FkbM family methyltransferase